MNEITEGSCKHLSKQPDAAQKCSVEELLDGYQFECVDRVDPPPDDASYLFEHYGMSNNSALPPEARTLYNKL